METFKMSHVYLENGDKSIQFKKSKRMDNGDTVDFDVLRFSRGKNGDYFSIGLSIYRKKKDRWVEEPIQTGKGNISGLIWARKYLLEFEDFIKDNPFYFRKNVIIFIGWTDIRRRRIYEWALRKYGYQNKFMFNTKGLAKVIQIEK